MFALHLMCHEHIKNHEAVNVHGPVDSDFKKWTFLKHLCNYIDSPDYQLYFYTSIQVMYFSFNSFVLSGFNRIVQ